VRPDNNTLDLYATNGTSPPRIEPMVNAQTVADYLGTTKSTVLAWHREGILRGYRPEGRIRPVRFRMSEVLAVMGCDGGL
jgi:excisionase family DNA binding protein